MSNYEGPSSPKDEGLADRRAKRPYKIGQESYWTCRELAAGLVGHWAQGIQDLERGAILQWLKSDLYDSDLVVFVVDQTRDSGISSDVSLLSLTASIET